MDKHSRKARHEYMKEPLHDVMISKQELMLIRESVEYTMKHQADEMLIYEYQLLLDDIDEILHDWTERGIV